MVEKGRGVLELNIHSGFFESLLNVPLISLPASVALVRGLPKADRAARVEAAVEAYLGTEVQPISTMFDFMYAKLPEVMEEQRDTAERYAGTGGH